MKHFFIASAFFFSIFFSSTQPSYAIFGVGDIVFDPAQYATQLPQYAKDIINTAANVATQANTYYTYLQSSVLDPLANALIIATQIQQQNNTINLITGSLGGNSLLVQNPEQWVQNKGLNSVRVNIGDVSQQNGTYSSSILGSVINSYRGTSNLTSVLGSLGNSSIPNIVQNNLCKDASLSNVAKNDVMKSDGTYDLEAYQNRKQDLFNSLCVGNPTINIPLARKLEAVGKQRPDIAGTDSLLAVSFGDNEYNRSVKSQVAIAEDKARKEKAAIDELNRNGGIANATKCDQFAQMDGSDAANIPCRTESVTNTGSVLNNAFQESVSGNLKKLMETFGPGAGKSIGSILSLVFSARSLSNPSDSTPVKQNAVQIQDLTDPAKKKEITTNTSEPLKAHLASLNSLESIEGRYVSALSAYEDNVRTVQMCYEQIVKDNPDNQNVRNDQRIIAALTFTANKIADIVARKAPSIKTLNSITAARVIINDTLISIASSQSTEEVLSLFNNYQQQDIPSLSMASIRESEFITFKDSLDDEITLATVKLTSLTNECAEIRQSYSQQNNQSNGGNGGGGDGGGGAF